MSWKTVTVTVDVDVDVDEVLDELSDDELLEELEERGINVDLSLENTLDRYLQGKGLPNLWTYSNDELCRFILKELNRI